MLRAIICDVGIADDEMIHGGVRRKEIFGAFRADAVGDFGAVELFLPGVGKGLIHVTGNDQGIGGLPGLWLVFQ